MFGLFSYKLLMKLLMKMNRYLLPKENAGALPRLESGTVFPERIEKKNYRSLSVSISIVIGFFS